VRAASVQRAAKAPHHALKIRTVDDVFNARDAAVQKSSIGRQRGVTAGACDHHKNSLDNGFVNYLPHARQWDATLNRCVARKRFSGRCSARRVALLSLRPIAERDAGLSQMGGIVDLKTTERHDRSPATNGRVG